MLLAWVCALAGAWIALLLCDGATSFHAALARRHKGQGVTSSMTTSSEASRSREGSAQDGGSPASPEATPAATDEAEAAATCACPCMRVTLASHAARPDVKSLLTAFAEEELASYAARDKGEEDAPEVSLAARRERELLVAAGGPKVLLATIAAALPSNGRLTRLTHPM